MVGPESVGRECFFFFQFYDDLSAGDDCPRLGQHNIVHLHSSPILQEILEGLPVESACNQVVIPALLGTEPFPIPKFTVDRWMVLAIGMGENVDVNASTCARALQFQRLMTLLLYSVQSNT